MPSVLARILLVAAGGAVGAVCRWALAGLVHSRLPESTFPWGTLAVNILGCLVIGFLWPLVEERPVLSPEARLLVLVGLLGAFTTFSTFSLETMELVSAGRWLGAGLNVLGSVAVGLVAVAAGMALARCL
jgi:CrcB protein